MTQLLRVLVTLSEDLSSNPSTQVPGLTTAWNPSSRGPDTGGACMHMPHRHCDKRTHSNENDSLLNLNPRETLCCVLLCQSRPFFHWTVGKNQTVLELLPPSKKGRKCPVHTNKSEVIARVQESTKFP